MGALPGLRRKVLPLLQLFLSSLPPGPRPPGAPIFIWLPVKGIRLPDRCPACGGAATTDFEIDRVEYLYLIFWLYTTRARLTARYCEACAAAMRRRRWHLWLRAGIPFGLVFFVMPIAASCRHEAAYQAAMTGRPAGWWGFAALLLPLLLLVEAGRWAWQAHTRRWTLGLRIAAIAEGRICLETDDAEYATQVRALNADAPKPAG